MHFKVCFFQKKVKIQVRINIHFFIYQRKSSVVVGNFWRENRKIILISSGLLA